MRRPAAFVLLLATLAVSHGAGCASSGGTSDDAPSYTEQYREGKYKEAYDGASRAARDLPQGSAREEAALVAGEAAAALGHNSDAERFLRPLLSSDNPDVAGHASATVGLIAQNAGRHAEAARLLSAAGDKLTGEDAARALIYAGDSLRASGRTPEAHAAWTRAQELAGGDPRLRQMIADRLAVAGGGPTIGGPPMPGAFTIQVGAYSTEQRAQQAADRLRDKASVLNLGNPRVIPVRSNGKTLYSVRVGGFPTREAAAGVARKLATDAVVIKSGG